MSATTEPTTNGVAVSPLSPLDMLTLPEAAAYLRLPADAVLSEVGAGRLRGRRYGDDWRFVREELIRWARPPAASSAREQILNAPVPDETEEEFQEFLAAIARHRDEENRLHGFGRYAPE